MLTHDEFHGIDNAAKENVINQVKFIWCET